MEKNLFITGISNDPYFNLASEEYLLKHRSENFIYLWVNAPSVIVGVNQNTLEEVNLAYTEDCGIKVARRQTGGGAVYHDLNNVNYTIIAPFDGDRDNYRYFTKGIIDYLATLGVKAEFSGRNDLVIDGKKFSGNAQCVYKKRIMHHGTLLLSTDKSVMENALKPHKFKVESKGIKSVRARVTNINEHLKTPLSAEQFMAGLKQFLMGESEHYMFTDEDVTAIQSLVNNKYSTFAWNIGFSPKAEIVGQKKFSYGLVKVNFNVLDGALQDVCFSGDFFSIEDINTLNRALNGVLYRQTDILSALQGVDKYICGSSPQDIVSLFFK